MLCDITSPIVMCCIICYIPYDIIKIRYITKKTLYDIKKVYMMYNLKHSQHSVYFQPSKSYASEIISCCKKLCI